jgi:RNA polymerase sigma factor (sigma-70 family)
VAASPTLVRGAAQVESVPAVEGARDLYERYYDRIFGYCLYQLGSREEAEDAAQTTFLWAFRALRRGVVPRAEDSWLFTIAKNSCRARHRSRGRSRQREVVSDPHILADISAAPAAQHDELIGLDDALARMPELQRQALLLREWKGLSYKEIAAELQLTDAAVETLIFRARRSLAELLNGKAAPKRARRYALDAGSIAAALKSLLGGASVVKVAVGVAAAVVVAAAVPAATKERVPPVAPRMPAATPTMPVEKIVGLMQRNELPPSAAEKPTRSKEAPPGSEDSVGETPEASEPTSPPSSIGQKVDDAVAELPLGSGLNDALPVDAVTDVVDQAVEDVDTIIDDVGTTLDAGATVGGIVDDGLLP